MGSLKRKAVVATAALAVAAPAAIAPSAGGSDDAASSADTRPPTQTIIASKRQDVDRLSLLVQVHERGNLVVTGKVGSYSFRSFKKKVAAHIPNTVRLSLASSAKRSVKSAIKRGSRVSARITSTATDSSGNRRSYKRTISLKP